MTITYTCDICHNPIKPGTGHINIDYSDIADYRQAMRAYEAEKVPSDSSWAPVDLAYLLAAPEPAKWRAEHTDCETVERADYAIAVGRADTTTKLLDWTLHLHGKGWIEDTDWEDLIRNRVLSPLGVDA